MIRDGVLCRVFVSYRREDSRDVAGRIYDRLAGHFGAENVFKDVDSIPLGVDFREHIRAAVERCDVLLAVVGPHWLTTEGPRGGRRLDDSSDFVRLEVNAALDRRIRVVPLLVGGATMPRADELPAELRDLAFRNAAPVRPDPDFHRDMDRLIEALTAGVATGGTRPAPGLPGSPGPRSHVHPVPEERERPLRSEAPAAEAVPETGYRYDVFLSFAPEDRAWALERLREPLSACRTREGRSVRICLDWKDSDITYGHKTMQGLSEAMSASRWCIVVVSNDYLDRSMNHWRLSTLARLERAEERVLLVHRDARPGGNLPLSPGWLSARGVEAWKARAVDAHVDGFLHALCVSMGLRGA